MLCLNVGTLDVSTGGLTSINCVNTGADFGATEHQIETLLS